MDDLKTRLLARVKIDSDGCWFWTGGKNRDGYGFISVGEGRTRAAHRVSYELFRGSIPEGLVLDHLCRHPYCVNPNHLEAVTQRTNILRSEGTSAYNARKTHCPRGHAYDVENTISRAHKRYCRECNRQWKRNKRRELSQLRPNRHNRSKTHCPHGHLYSQDNTRIVQGKRYCKTCHRQSEAERRRERKGADIPPAA